MGAPGYEEKVAHAKKKKGLYKGVKVSSSLYYLWSHSYGSYCTSRSLAVLGCLPT